MSIESRVKEILEHQNGLCMDVEEEQIILTEALVKGLEQEIHDNVEKMIEALRPALRFTDGRVRLGIGFGTKTKEGLKATIERLVIYGE